MLAAVRAALQVSQRRYFAMLSYATRAAKKSEVKLQSRTAAQGCMDDGWLHLMQRCHAITGRSLPFDHVAKEEALQQLSSVSFRNETVKLPCRRKWHWFEDRSLSARRGRRNTKYCILHTLCTLYPETSRSTFRGSSH